jgi:hypothetical protein
MEMVGGDGQFGPAGTELPEPASVRLLDADDLPVPGMPVTFSVVAGGGSIAPSTAFTGDDGVAQATWVLGPEPGANRVQAEAGDVEGSPALFVARADPEDGSTGGSGTTGCGCAIVH